jgi:chemotaxis signal transduction protein
MNQVAVKANKETDLVAEDEIRLLIFKIMGVSFGADMEQIEEMVDFSQAQQEDWDIRHFTEAISFRDIEVEYKKPKVVLIKDSDQDVGIVIDQPENIVNINFQSIRLLPPLLENQETVDPIWAAVFLEEDLILLVDFYRLQDSLPKIENLESLEKIEDIEIEPK